MAIETIRITDLSVAHAAIGRMAIGSGPDVIPCLTANGGKICANATPEGCTSKRDEGLVITPSGIECPRQLGSLNMRGTNGSAPVNPVLK